jgi:sarcosine oxidase subunit gamma
MDNLANSNTPVYESALEKYSTGTVFDNLQIREKKKLAYIIIRGKQEDDGFIDAMHSLGLSVPRPTNITNNNDKQCIWISPDEFLLVSDYISKDEFINKANTAFENIFAYAIDNSGSYTNISISGTRYLDVMAKLSPYNYKKLEIDCVLSTNLAKAPSIIFRTGEDSLTILVRFSFADYLWQMIGNASTEYK